MSLDGQPYRALPTAFRYRTTFDPSCSCKAPNQSWVAALSEAERLLAHLGARPDELWAYGDSEGDRELLALAHHAVLLRRGLTLTAAPAPGPDR